MNSIDRRLEKLERKIKREYVKGQTKSRIKIKNKLMELQYYMCAICGDNLSDNRHKIALDHCHKTNIIRGVLCFNCNCGLGHFKDNIEILISAIEYLKR